MSVTCALSPPLCTPTPSDRSPSLPVPRFGQVYTERSRPPGWDRVRNAEIGNKNFELDVLEEAYTTEHWIVRIYKVKDLPNRG